MPSQIGGQNFSVFCDDAPPQSRGGASALPAPTGEWENMPTQQTRKENDRVAGPWTGGQRVSMECLEDKKLTCLNTFIYIIISYLILPLLMQWNSIYIILISPNVILMQSF